MLAVVGGLVLAIVVAGLIWRFSSGTEKATKPAGGKKSQPQKKAQKKAPAPAAASEKEAEAAVVAASSDDGGLVETGEASKKGKKAAAAAPAPSSAAAAAKKQPQAKAKGKAQPKGKAAPKKEEEEENEPEVAPPVHQASVAEDEAADWEVAVAGPKKNIKRRERILEQKEEQKAAAKAVKQQPRAIPGMAPVEAVPVAAAPVPKTSKVLALSAEQEKAVEDVGKMSLPVTVPEKMIGRIIGPKGATLKMIQEKTGVEKIDTSGEVFTLLGPAKAVELAKMAIQEIVEKGYTSLQFEDFSATFVQVHPSMFPEIIGKQGCVIRKIKEELQVEVGIPEVPKEAIAGKKKFKVTLAGSADNVNKAKEVLTDIMTYYHHDLTHPDQVHEEIEIEPWQLNFVIGKRGSEIKHIQANYKVRLYIPNENSLSQTPLLVGERPCVDRAKAYIDKLLWNSQAQVKGRDANSGAYDGDAWGEEEEHEDWMEGYIYKRR